ncbi:hypothetical protein Ocin01_12779 [Orchesella cincta]|uniref:Uncharacterized protein n=1 Tax=Orchesella cincta TaxID=48709 RepID=A0A1D2MLU9_ORCCI|nr:hypothetical protein Ocin01_12779 [Orchesella cincta]
MQLLQQQLSQTHQQHQKLQLSHQRNQLQQPAL